VIDVLNLLIVHAYIRVSGPSSQMMRRPLSLNAAFLKLWPADHKWSSGSALVVLLD